MNYVLSQEAEDDLIRIYCFGYFKFGELQADMYYDSLFACFERIAKNPDQFPSADRIRLGYRFCVCGSDTIYFREGKPDEIEIIRIIGRQDF
jgi:toxin ParE1/3/4